MSAGQGIQQTEIRSSNRAPVSVSGATAGGYFESGNPLLAAAGDKRFKVKTTKMVQPRGPDVQSPIGSAPGVATGAPVATYQSEVATRVRLVNRSGQPAEITLIVGKNEDGSQFETPDAPILVPNGETLDLPLRVVEVIEKNVGNAIQVTPGVCYVFLLESRLSP